MPTAPLHQQPGRWVNRCTLQVSCLSVQPTRQPIRGNRHFPHRHGTLPDDRAMSYCRANKWVWKPRSRDSTHTHTHTRARTHTHTCIRLPTGRPERSAYNHIQTHRVESGLKGVLIAKTKKTGENQLLACFAHQPSKCQQTTTVDHPLPLVDCQPLPSLTKKNKGTNCLSKCLPSQEPCCHGVLFGVSGINIRLVVPNTSLISLGAVPGTGKCLWVWIWVWGSGGVQESQARTDLTDDRLRAMVGKGHSNSGGNSGGTAHVANKKRPHRLYRHL
jgi:hypothetical protein